MAIWIQRYLADTGNNTEADMIATEWLERHKRALRAPEDSDGIDRTPRKVMIKFLDR
jgi:hypothetical protein